MDAIASALVLALSIVGIFYIVYRMIDGGNPFLLDIAPAPSGVLHQGDETPQVKMLFFKTDWCPHCKKAMPQWEILQEKLQADRIEFEVIDCDEQASLAKLYKVNAFPTFKLLADNRVFSYKGPARSDTLATFVQKVLGTL